MTATAVTDTYAATPDPGNAIIVDVPAEIADLVGPYLVRRKQDHQQFMIFARSARWADVQGMAHRIKGNAGSFGFARLSEIGAGIEVAAERGDAPAVERLVDEMGAYLGRLKLRQSTR